MVKMFLDTEFNGFGGETISLALVVQENGEVIDTFYLASEIEAEYDPWVADNVIPVLHVVPVPKEDFRTYFLAFILQYDNPEIIVDWPSDIVLFFKLLLGDTHLDTIHYPCTVSYVKLPELAPGIPHCALSDAEAIRVAYNSKYGA